MGVAWVHTKSTHPMASGCYAGLELQALLAPVASPSIAQCSLHIHIKGAAVAAKGWFGCKSLSDVISPT